MPFFRVRVVTGNACDCARMGGAAIPDAHNNRSTVPRYLIVFMNPPLTRTLYLRRMDTGKCLHLSGLLHDSSANTRTGPPEPPSSLIGATTRNAPFSGSSLKSA